MRPPRSVSAPVARASTPVSPTVRTPAAQMTVRLVIRSLEPPTSIVTPRESIAVARTPSRTVTPSSASPLAALADSDSLNGARTRSPASSRITCESSGAIRA